MFDLLILSGVIGSFCFFIPGRLGGDELFSLYFLALVTILSFFSPPKRNCTWPAFGVFMLTALLSICFTFHTPQRWVTLNLLIAGLAAKTMIERTDLTMEKLGCALLLFFALHNSALCLQRIGLILTGTELAGTFVMPWVMGCAACLAIPFVKRFDPWACLFLAPSLLLSHSSICIPVALLMFFQGRMKKFAVWGSVVAAALIYIRFFDAHIDTVRFTTYINTSKYIHHWLVGNGIGSFGHMGFIHFNGSTPELWKWAHIEPYGVMFEQGLLGLAALGLLIGNVFHTARGAMRYALLGVILLSLFHPIFHFPRLIVLIILIIVLSLKGELAWE